MPPAKLKATAVTAKAPPTAMIQPVRGSVRRRRLSAAMPRPPTTAVPSIQPAWPPSASFSSRRAPVAPPKVPLRRPAAPGPPVWPSRRPKPLYSQISDQIELSLVPEIQGRLDGRGQPDEDRPGEGHREQRRAAIASWRTATSAPRRDPEPGQRHPGDDQQRRAHLRLEAEADERRRRRQPLGRAVPQRPQEAPERADAAEDQQRVRVVVAGDRDDHRGQRQRQAGEGPGGAAEAAAGQVVEEADRGDPHQRLRHQDRQRVEAEEFDRERLDPEGRGGLSTVISPLASKEP